MQGVYWIINWLDLKRYIGSARDIQDRWGSHLRGLRTNKHNNQHLQSAWNKYIPEYGEEIFVLEVIEKVKGSRESAFDREQLYLGLWWGSGLLYNKAKDAMAPMRDYEFSKEHRANIGKARKGKKLSEEWRANIAKAQLGSVGYWAGKEGPASKPYPAFYNKITGETIPAGINLARMCRECNLNYVSMDGLRGRGRKCTREGWVIEGSDFEDVGMNSKKPYPAFYNEQTEHFVPAGTNLTRMCRKQELNYNVMHGLKRGDWEQSPSGWRLATLEEVGEYG